MKAQNGFSLMELLIVVAIIGIISAFAYPSYQETVRKTKRSDCAGALTSLANAMERHFTVTGSYLGAAKNGANTGQPGIFAVRCPISGDTPTYNLRIQAATASTYNLRAIPLNSMLGDKCGRLNLNNTGKKWINGATSGTNWKACW